MKVNYINKIYKFIVLVCLFTLGIVMSHEYSVDEFNFKSMFAYVEIEDYSEMNIITDAFQTFEDEQLSSLLCLVEDNNERLEEIIYIIGNDVNINKLNNKMYRCDETQTRLFGYSKTIRTVSVNEYDTLLENKNIKEVYLILLEDEEIVRNISAEWIWQNGMDTIHIPKTTVENAVSKKMFVIWGSICGICVFVSCYIDLLSRKKRYLDVLFGKNGQIIILADIATDAFGYILLFFWCFCISDIIGIIFWPTYSVLLLCVVLFSFDIIRSLLMFRTSIRKVLVTDASDQKILFFTFALKGFVVATLIFAISLNGKSISEYIKISKCTDFYSIHSDFYMFTEPEQKYWDEYYSFFKNEEVNGNAELYVYYYMTKEGYPVYRINKNTLCWLERIYPSLNNCNIETNAVIAPNCCSVQAIDEIVEVISSVCDENMDVIYYNENRYLPLIEAGKFDFPEFSNRIIFICYEYIPEEEFEYEADFLWAIYRSETDSVWLNNEVQLKGNNIATPFFLEVKIRKVEFICVLSLVSFLVVIHIILSINLVNIEFKLNSKLFILRRINGMSVVSAYGFMFIADIVWILLGMIVSLLVFCRYINDFNLLLSICGMIILIFSEAIILLVCIIINEKKSMHKVIKSGGI